MRRFLLLLGLTLNTAALGASSQPYLLNGIRRLNVEACEFAEFQGGKCRLES